MTVFRPLRRGSNKKTFKNRLYTMRTRAGFLPNSLHLLVTMHIHT